MADILAAQPNRSTEPADSTAKQQSDTNRIYTEEERLEHDRSNMIRALEAAGWRVSGPDGAAALVALRPSTFTDRMKKYAISRPH